MKNLNQMTHDHCELGNKCEEELDGGGMQSEITVYLCVLQRLGGIGFMICIWSSIKNKAQDIGGKII